MVYLFNGKETIPVGGAFAFMATELFGS